jgi:adenylate cyclase
LERRLSAIVAADVVGYSRLMERDEADTFGRLRARREELFEPEIERHHGRIFKLMGDGLLAEFASVVDAVECAVALQRGMAERDDGLPADRRIDVRIGINLGDVIIEGEDRHGEGVIIAARLEQLAEPGGIAVSRTVVNHVKHKLALRFESLGDQKVKNIAEPIAVYRVAMDPAAVPAAHPRWNSRHRIALISVGLVLLLGGSASWRLWGLGWLRQEVGKAAPASTIPPPTTVAAAESASLPGPIPKQSSPEQEEGIPAIVVLPFQDLTGDRAESDLGKGIAEAFTTDLATFPDFQVISSTSAFAYAGRPVPEIVKATGAEFVIEGSIRRSGNKAMVTMQLIRGSTDRHLMIAQLEENLQDPVALQNVVTGKLRDQLGGMSGVLRQESLKIAEAKAEGDLTEYDYYILGHFHWFRGERELAGDVWKKGLARYPTSVLLRCKLSFYYFDNPRATELMAEAAKLPRKTTLDEWYYHWASSKVEAELAVSSADYERATLEAKAAIAIAPYDTQSRADLSEVLIMSGHMDEAVEWVAFAVENEPHPQRWQFNSLYNAYRAAGRMNQLVKLALAKLAEVEIARNPPALKQWYDLLGKAYSTTGQTEKADEAYRKEANLPDLPAE